MPRIPDIRWLAEPEEDNYPAASGLPLLGLSNIQVDKNREKIRAGKAISPLLLVRDTARGKVVIADGYHRLCAVYSLHQDTPIPCRIA